MQGYSASTTDAEARAAFVARYGKLPEKIIRTKGAVLTGPIPEDDND